MRIFLVVLILNTGTGETERREHQMTSMAACKAAEKIYIQEYPNIITTCEARI